MSAGSLAGFVKVCTASEAGVCTAEAWMPAPSAVPVMSMEFSMALFCQSAAVIVYAWGWRVLSKQIRWG